MHNFEVIGKLTHNGCSLKDGDPISLPAEDGKILAAIGRVKPASKKARAVLQDEAPGE